MTGIGNIQLAWRNLWRNRRRSAATILSLAFGFAAVALFAGYTSAVYVALSNAAIHAELIGHLTINRQGWQTEGKLHPDKYLLTADEIRQVQAIVEKRLPGARLIPKLSATGLLSNGKSSTIFVGAGIAPADLDLLRGPFRFAPGALKEDQPQGVTAAQGLADVLGLKIGDSASVLASTLHGQANASDVDISDAVNTGNVATNDKLMLMPLALVQDLMDAKDRAETLTVLLPGEGHADSADAEGRLRDMYTRPAPSETQSVAVREQLSADFKAAGLDMEVRTWQEMSAFFRQVKGMYDMIFALMLAVVLAIVVLSIANAMSMAVVERTREIGTLRAIGVRRSGIAKLFVNEALMLVLVGTITGLLLTAAVRWGVNVADIRYVPPSNTQSVPIYIGFDLPRTAFAAVVLAVLAVFAAYWPARRAAHHSITASLGHV